MEFVAIGLHDQPLALPDMVDQLAGYGHVRLRLPKPPLADQGEECVLHLRLRPRRLVAHFGQRRLERLLAASAAAAGEELVEDDAVEQVPALGGLERGPEL